MLYKNIKVLSVGFIVVLLILSFALFGINNLFTKGEKDITNSLQINNRKTDIILQIVKKKYLFRNPGNKICDLSNIKKKIDNHLKTKKIYIDKIKKLKINIKKKELIKHITSIEYFKQNSSFSKIKYLKYNVGLCKSCVFSAFPEG